MTRQVLDSSKSVAPHSHYKQCHADRRKCSMQEEESELLREITVLLRRNRPLQDPSTHSLSYMQNLLTHNQTQEDNIASSSPSAASSASSFSDKEHRGEVVSGHSFDEILMGAASFDPTSYQDPVPCMDHRKDLTSTNNGGKQRAEKNVNTNINNNNKNNGCSSCLAVAPPSAQIRHHPKRNMVRVRKTKACKTTRQSQPNNEAIEYKERVINPINADSVGHQMESIRSTPYSATLKEEEEEEELVTSFNKQDKSESKSTIVQWKRSMINHRRGKSLNPEAGLGSFSASRTAYSSSPVETTSEFHSDTESLPLLFESTADSQDTSEQGMERFRSARSHRRRVMNRVASASSPLKGRHLSLSEKYMPRSFDEIIGQSFVIQALKNALRRGKIAPMYIFYGPRGTGKTSCARLLAMSLTCLSVTEPDPCGSCAECIAHLSGETSILNRVGSKHNIRRANNYLNALLQDTSTATTKSSSSSYYKAFILDECNSLSAQAWSAYIELLEDAPSNTVFILSASNLEQFPPVIISRSQKFFFAKMKENEMVRKLKVVAAKEQLEIEPEALKLIVASSNGSLQDAETTLEQLSLLGPKISATMVQELIGLVPEEKLVELLHFALSRDYVSTVNSLKELTEAGVEPVALISQLASLVTQILTCGYEAPKERNGCHLLKKEPLSKEETETLRRALKTLSEAEKQLRSSSDPWTWLTAALLQFASDQSHIQSSNYQDKGKHYKSSPFLETSDVTSQNQSKGPPSELIAASDPLSFSYSKIRSCDRAHPGIQTDGKVNELEDIWRNTLDSMCSNNLRQLLSYHGRLVSLSFCKAFTVATIGFSQEEHRSCAERSSTTIARAFESILGRLVEVRVTLYDTRDEQIQEEAFMIPSKNNNNEGEEAEENPWTRKGESAPYGSMRRTSGIRNWNHGDEGKKLHLDAAWNTHDHDQDQDIDQDFDRDQNFHQASAESACKLDKAYRHSCKAKELAKRSNKGGRFNFRFLHSHHSESIIQEEDIDGPELHVANIHKGDHMHIKAAAVDSSPGFSAAEDNSGIAGFLCWKRTRGHRKEKVTWCERGPGILLGLVPCPKSYTQ